jgi:hypothetical protein
MLRTSADPGPREAQGRGRSAAAAACAGAAAGAAVIAAFFSLVDKIDARRRWALRAAPRRRGMGGAAGQRCTPPMDCDQPLTRARHRFRALDVSAARLRLNKMPFIRTIRWSGRATRQSTSSAHRTPKARSCTSPTCAIAPRGASSAPRCGSMTQLPAHANSLLLLYLVHPCHHTRETLLHAFAMAISACEAAHPRLERSPSDHSRAARRVEHRSVH